MQSLHRASGLKSVNLDETNAPIIVQKIKLKKKKNKKQLNAHRYISPVGMRTNKSPAVSRDKLPKED
ncbi:hypothetical protein POVWA2_034580 [Plasmodium ovale wallikeri]|uniref:Uncharacterized protein n=1 Tax=Plasmodium ovale wallikeri TaxID=864142 RepID=A0A1A8Z245_PLAOA|nr:hypothetical protein POVWA1_032270 [Plasmodium ovale wallikeri]SBT37832.1 hypothetical protein POVWA2_034580 [Plasmodium ovale wallikeri]